MFSLLHALSSGWIQGRKQRQEPLRPNRPLNAEHCLIRSKTRAYLIHNVPSPAIGNIEAVQLGLGKYGHSQHKRLEVETTMGTIIVVPLLSQLIYEGTSWKGSMMPTSSLWHHHTHGWCGIHWHIDKANHLLYAQYSGMPEQKEIR